jgi:hypothetical protein
MDLLMRIECLMTNGHKKAVRLAGTALVWMSREKIRLLDLGFLVGNMLADLGIKFHDLHFFRHRALVFGRGVEVTRACGRFQLDFVAAFSP